MTGDFTDATAPAGGQDCRLKPTQPQPPPGVRVSGALWLLIATAAQPAKR
jgi:hypothetical protein